LAKACVFCGARKKLTKEHVFAAWVGHLFPNLSKSTNEMIRRDGTVHVFESMPFTHTIRIVCVTCNTGWMSSIEGSVKSVLGPMLRRGLSATLTPSFQAQLAMWAVKSALVLDRMHPAERVIPDSEYSRFYKSQQPSSKYVVWIGRRASFFDHTGRELVVASRQEHITSFSADSAASKAEAEQWVVKGHTLFKITFTVGHVVFQIFGHDLPGTIVMNHAAADVLQQIWPVEPRFAWPPPQPIEAIGGFLALHELLKGPAQQPN
jgi:hypothetical protein